MKIPFFDATRQTKKNRKALDLALGRVLDSGKFVLGKELEAFEIKFSAYIGSKNGVGVNSGTDALKIALRGLGVSPGDEVITVPNTAVPTVSAIREIGATPVFVDIDKSFNIDIKKIEGAITKKTKAIVPVHLYGQPADMKSIMAIAKKNNLFVVEDCAQATGAFIGSKKVGSFGDAGCFSFYPTKNLGANGDGGMITTNNADLAKVFKRLRMYGMEGSYYSHIEGYNSRLDEFQAAILLEKLKKLDVWNERRIDIAKKYAGNIKNEFIKIPSIKTGHVFHLFVVRVKQPYRDQFISHLTNMGIGHGIHYPFPIHLQVAYGFLGYKEGSFAETESASREIVSLPIFPELTEKEISYIIKSVNAFSPR